MNEYRAVTGCPHRGFRFDETPPLTYRARCEDCGVDTVISYPLARHALEEFERQVKDHVKREEKASERAEKERA